MSFIPIGVSRHFWAVACVHLGASPNKHIKSVKYDTKKVKSCQGVVKFFVYIADKTLIWYATYDEN